MNPYTFYKIVFFVLAYGIGGSAFSINNFFANDGKQVLINGGVQYLAYIGAQAVGNHFSPAILFPIVTNSKVAANFIQAAGPLPTQGERAATVALVFSAAAAVTKSGDIPTNVAIGPLIATFVQYMLAFISIKNGNIPFAYIRRRRLNFTTKQHIQYSNGAFTYRSNHRWYGYSYRYLLLWKTSHCLLQKRDIYCFK